MLLRWANNPSKKPKGLITLVSGNSTVIYSGMLPGIIAGDYCLEEAQINLRKLAEKANVSFVNAEIVSLDLNNKSIRFRNRADISFTHISLNVGAETFIPKKYRLTQSSLKLNTIKPFDKFIKWIEYIENQEEFSRDTFNIVGSGLSAIEIAFSLRKRWPQKRLNLYSKSKNINVKLKKHLNLASIKILVDDRDIYGSTLLCTGNQIPKWLIKSGLDIDSDDRVLTHPSLQSLNHSFVFAVGDCGVIKENKRPPSGVFAVRASKPLSKNIERLSNQNQLKNWKPQKKGLQLFLHSNQSGKRLAWLLWGKFLIGPSNFIFVLKRFIDYKFMRMFADLSLMKRNVSTLFEDTLCRGCASKISYNCLKNALEKATISDISSEPEDASILSETMNNKLILQSVDGFPSLLSDPWINGRLTTLHACSDLWACGASVSSVQPIISIPSINKYIQTELLTQVLCGIKSALVDQNARIIGGHTIESRSKKHDNLALGIDISLSVNGITENNSKIWKKYGLKKNDVILISKPLGSGVFFAAAMKTIVPSNLFDDLMLQLINSQFPIWQDLVRRDVNSESGLVHACTDITGFGLIGHLSEMLLSTNYRCLSSSKKCLKIILDAENVPSFNGAMELFDKGISSSFAPSNRKFLNLIDNTKNENGFFEVNKENLNSPQYKNFLELIIDPQTCGPLVISCSEKASFELIATKNWTKIGSVDVI